MGSRMIKRKFFFLLSATVFCIILSGSLAGKSLPSLRDNVKFKPLQVMEDHWYVYYIGDRKIGYMNEKIIRGRTGSSESYQSSTFTSLEIERFGHTLAIEKRTEVVEDPGGELLEFYLYNKISRVPIEVYGENTDGLVRCETRSGGVSKWSTIMVDDDVLMPYKAKKYGVKMGYARDNKYDVKIFRPSVDSMTPLNMHVRVHDREEVPYFGTNKYLYRITAEMDNYPGLAVQYWSDRSGTVWKMNPGLMNMVCFKVTKDTALKKEGRFDLALATVVIPNMTIPSPEKVNESVFKITVKNKDEVLLPDSTFQKTEKRIDTGIVMRTSRPGPDINMSFPSLKKKSGVEEFLKANHYIQSESEKMKNLAKSLIGEDDNVWNAVCRLRDWVSKNITKRNYNVGYATSLEVLELREGDCTEHSVLFTALARAAGIPSRVVLGMTYVNLKTGPVFAFHQWSQVWVGRWIAVDPALNQNIADATHIVFMESSFNDRRSPGNIGISLLKLLGNIKIQILSFK